MRNVDQLVGSPIEAGVIVTPKGRPKAVMTGAAIGQAAGSALKVGAEMAAERAGGGRSPLGTRSGKIGYLALTATELVLLDGHEAGAPCSSCCSRRSPRG